MYANNVTKAQIITGSTRELEEFSEEKGKYRTISERYMVAINLKILKFEGDKELRNR